MTDDRDLPSGERQKQPSKLSRELRIKCFHANSTQLSFFRWRERLEFIDHPEQTRPPNR